jgi:beta-alanine--pyruvate transaminase
MGAVVVSEHVFDAFMDGPDNLIELFHGYTYSSHPLACAAGLATLNLYEKENLFARAADLEGYWQDAVHGLRGLANITDIRNIGLTAGIELAPRDGAPGARGYDALTGCFEAGALVRVTGDIIALSPPLIIDQAQIDALLAIVAGVIENTR